MDVSVAAILLFIVVSAAIGLTMLGVGRFFGPRRRTAVKQMPYESGMDPVHDTRRRFDVRFHLVAIAFLIFDVELLFLYPWAVASRHPDGLDKTYQGAAEAGALADRGLVFWGVMVFFTVLALGLLYDWRKGVFRWR